jgi:hypothetical protein
LYDKVVEYNKNKSKKEAIIWNQYI